MSEFELKEKHSKKITKAIKMLNEAMAEIRQYIPDANYYLEDNDNFNTLSGDSHEGIGFEPCQYRILQHDTLNNSGGGGW